MDEMSGENKIWYLVTGRLMPACADFRYDAIYMLAAKKADEKTPNRGSNNIRSSSWSVARINELQFRILIKQTTYIHPH
jgi:hypothetical protein